MLNVHSDQRSSNTLALLYAMVHTQEMLPVEKLNLGGDGVDQVALIIIGFADPVVCSLLPVGLSDVED